MNNDTFRELVWQKGRELYRDMPWRKSTDPYRILVSELMLQQTQVARVIPKYEAFIERFPDVYTLAYAPLADVLILWNGLGYNRRAKFLHEAAKKIVIDFNGMIPTSLSELVSLPGIGHNTASAILAYSFNEPTVFIETNIRSVYFYHFFDGDTSVSDQELLNIVHTTLDIEHPREWYWALMDYGSYLKSQGAGQINKSTHYKKQTPLRGSVREVRGQIIRVLTRSDMTPDEVRQELLADERFDTALQDLIKEGMVQYTNTYLHLTK